MFMKNTGNTRLIVNYVLGKARRVYFMAIPENKEELKKSRIYFTISDACAQTIAQLAGGTFLVSLMAYVGMSDANIGVIISLGSFLALFQLITLGYVRTLKKYKFFVCVTALQRIFFVLMYFVPILMIDTRLQIILLVTFYCIAQTCIQIGTPATQDWIASLVPGRLRGRYLSIKDSVVVAVIATVMLGSGVLLDYFKQTDLVVGFCLIGMIILILVMVNVVCLSLMKEPRLAYINRDGKEMHGRITKAIKAQEKSTKQESLWTELKEALGSKHFMKMITLNCLWMTCFYIASPFNASYQIKELALPYTFIMVIGFLANLVRIYLTPKIGKIADKYGMAKILKYVMFALGVSYLVTAFTVPSNAYVMVIIGTTFSALGWTFIGPGLFGVQLEFLNKDKRVIQLTILSSLSGVYGFAVSYVGSRILNYLQYHPLEVAGKSIYAQQVLNVLGFLMIIITVTYIKVFVESERIKINNQDGKSM